jgi:hypothetical protein
MTTKEVNQNAAIQETKRGAERHGPQFIPKLRGKKVIIRLTSGGQPITGTIEGYNPMKSSSRLQKGNFWSLSMLLLLSRVQMNRKDTGQIVRDMPIKPLPSKKAIPGLKFSR